MAVSVLVLEPVYSIFTDPIDPVSDRPGILQWSRCALDDE
jgi:hypothetical protein